MPPASRHRRPIVPAVAGIDPRVRPGARAWAILHTATDGKFHPVRLRAGHATHRDGTYFVTEAEAARHRRLRWLEQAAHALRRRPDEGERRRMPRPTNSSTPPTEPARIRAFFVAPGVGTARRRHAPHVDEVLGSDPHRRFHAASNLPPPCPARLFYRRWGFTADRRVETTLPDGTEIAFIQMSYKLDAQPDADPVSSMSHPPDATRSLFLSPFVQVFLCALLGTTAEVLLKIGATHFTTRAGGARLAGADRADDRLGVAEHFVHDPEPVCLDVRDPHPAAERRVHALEHGPRADPVELLGYFCTRRSARDAGAGSRS